MTTPGTKGRDGGRQGVQEARGVRMRRRGAKGAPDCVGSHMRAHGSGFVHMIHLLIQNGLSFDGLSLIRDQCSRSPPLFTW